MTHPVDAEQQTLLLEAQSALVGAVGCELAGVCVDYDGSLLTLHVFSTRELREDEREDYEVAGTELIAGFSRARWFKVAFHEQCGEVLVWDGLWAFLRRGFRTASKGGSTHHHPTNDNRQDVPVAFFAATDPLRGEGVDGEPDRSTRSGGPAQGQPEGSPSADAARTASVLPGEVLLQVQAALLGVVGCELAGACLDYDDTGITLHVFCEGEFTRAERKIYDAVGTTMLAGLPYARTQQVVFHEQCGRTLVGDGLWVHMKRGFLMRSARSPAGLPVQAGPTEQSGPGQGEPS